MSSAALLDRDAVAATAATVETPEPLTPHRYRLTVAEYHRLGEIGIFDEDSRVELIEGDLIAMPPIGEQHASHDPYAQPAIFTASGRYRHGGRAKPNAWMRVRNPSQMWFCSNHARIFMKARILARRMYCS